MSVKTACAPASRCTRAPPVCVHDVLETRRVAIGRRWPTQPDTSPWPAGTSTGAAGRRACRYGRGRGDVSAAPHSGTTAVDPKATANILRTGRRNQWNRPFKFGQRGAPIFLDSADRWTKNRAPAGISRSDRLPARSTIPSLPSFTLARIAALIHRQVGERTYPAGCSYFNTGCGNANYPIPVSFSTWHRRCRNAPWSSIAAFFSSSNNGTNGQTPSLEGGRERNMISTIICSINPRKFDAISDNLTDRLGDGPLEIIGIHDARSLAEGYNRGIDQSKGDILVFCHDDVEIIAPSGSQLLRQHLQTHDLVGCAGTSRLIDSNWICAGDPFVHGIVAYPAEDAWPAGRFDVAVWGKLHRTIVEDIQALDGFFFAANRRVFDVIRFDERNFDGFHVYDIDFTFAAHLAGFRTAVCKDILIAHQSSGNFDEEYRNFSARFMNKYRAQLTAQAHGTRKMALARNLDRAQLRQLYGTVVGTPR
jgi:hypothetical protein